MMPLTSRAPGHGIRYGPRASIPRLTTHVAAKATTHQKGYSEENEKKFWAKSSKGGP
jgi:hypothetical protein